MKDPMQDPTQDPTRGATPAAIQGWMPEVSRDVSQDASQNAALNGMAFPIVESSQVGEARRYAVELGRSIGFTEEDANNAALVVTEVGMNLVKHAAGGQVLIRIVDRRGCTGIETTALDTGPGMADIEVCLRDGYSTAGTPGTGMGAVQRRSDEFDIWSARTVGTAIVSRVFRRADAFSRAAEGLSSLRIGAVCRPIPSEVVCGDAWSAIRPGSCERFLLVDGLGHGSGAAEAANEAVRIFRTGNQRSLPEVLDSIHRGLRHTRGAALALIEFDPADQVIRFLGVGNIAAAVLSHNGARSMMSHNGTVGHLVRHIQEMEYPWPKQSLVVLNSDGLKSRWSLDAYPGLVNRDPSLVAAILYRDFQRGSDDVTVLAIRAVES